MADPITIESTVISLLPALIGAIGGSFGGTIISNYLKEKSERESKRRSIIDTYLIQLQDFTETLWHRFNNIKNQGGRFVMNSYFEESTLYSLGCILAYRRILLFEGIYSQIDILIPGLGGFLKEKLNDLDKILDTGRVSLYRYHRLLLAEVIIEKENGKLNVCSYLKFKEIYEDNQQRIKDFLKPSKEWVSNLKGHEVEPLMMILNEIIKRIVKETGIETNINEL